MAEMKIPVSIVGDGLVILQRKHYDELVAMERTAVLNLIDLEGIKSIHQKAYIIKTSPNAWDVPTLAKEIVEQCDKMLKRANEVVR